MSGNAKSKANKGKPKTNNGQLTQNASNGGHAVSSQSDHNNLFDMTHMGSGQGISQGMPQGPNMYPPRICRSIKVSIRTRQFQEIYRLWEAWGMQICRVSVRVKFDNKLSRQVFSMTNVVVVIMAFSRTRY